MRFVFVEIWPYSCLNRLLFTDDVSQNGCPLPRPRETEGVVRDSSDIRQTFRLDWNGVMARIRHENETNGNSVDICCKNQAYFVRNRHANYKKNDAGSEKDTIISLKYSVYLNRWKVYIDPMSDECLTNVWRKSDECLTNLLNIRLQLRERHLSASFRKYNLNSNMNEI